MKLEFILIRLEFRLMVQNYLFSPFGDNWQTGTFFAIQEYITRENISVAGSYAPQEQVPTCPGFAVRTECSRILVPLPQLFTFNGTLLTLLILTSGAL
jgi:hypothetical protein